MAKQHFYSRVPAKMSLFNKMDGYDTFAYSEGLSRELIEKELSRVYDSKPTKEDAVLIQNGKLPAVYCQFVTDEGETVQSAVSYIASDYTGERSSYMTHSLVLSEEENKKRLFDTANMMFDIADFKNDLSDFSLVSKDSEPSEKYPEAVIQYKQAQSAATLIEKYDAGMLKRLIYAFLGICCGKIKTLYLSIPSGVETFSADTVDFLNTVLQIFPYHLRTMLSFVTYAGDLSKYPTFKIKGVYESYPEIPVAKGARIKMGAQDYTGISDQNIAQNAPVVDFLFNLMTSEAERKDFLLFCDNAVKKVPSFAKPSFKNIDELVFLFKVLSGYTPEKEVLPDDDACLKYITVYDKNKEVLPDEYKVRSMDFLKRYSETNTAIPKNVFSKLTSVYNSENNASKHTVMTVVLDLIHTDVMREKLFGFIKSNYPKEDAETRKTIMFDMCRVYYGGFLQGKIIDFFTEYFEKEPEDVRMEIVERLLLTIRTPAVQNQVLGFTIDKYRFFNGKEKDLFYSVFNDMLPFGDQLVRNMADIVDANIEEDRKSDVSSSILSNLESDSKKKQPKLLPVLMSKPGFTESVATHKIVTDWSGRKIFDEYVGLISTKPLGERIEALCSIWKAAPDMDKNAIGKLFEGYKANFKKGLELFSLIDCRDKLIALSKEIPESKDFVDSFNSELVEPSVVSLIGNAFDIKRYPTGIEDLISKASERAFIENSEPYANIILYKGLLKAVAKEDIPTAAVHSVTLGEKLKDAVAAHFDKDAETENASDEMLVAIKAVAGMLKKGVFAFESGANALTNRLNAKANENENNTLDNTVFKTVIKVGNLIYSSGISEQCKEMMISENSEIEKCIVNYVSKNKKANKFVEECFAEIKCNEVYAQYIRKTVNDKMPKGFFGRLFGK